MPRPQRCRRICKEPKFNCFRPESKARNEIVILTLDEFETIRLVDLEKLTHDECAKQMDISRTTVTEIYETARHKIADSIVNGKSLHIEGGNYKICDGNAACPRFKRCTKTLIAKGENTMKIAVTYENGQIFQHFGHCEQFKIYEVQNGEIVSAQVVGTNGSGHGALTGFLAAQNVDTLICGGIGGGAQNALSEAGIKFYGGVSGDADYAVNMLVLGKLSYNPDVHCEHHDHENGGEHHCGEHGCH